MANKALKYRFALKYTSNTGVDIIKDTKTYVVSLSSAAAISHNTFDLTTSSIELDALNPSMGTIGAVYIVNHSTGTDAEVVVGSDDTLFDVSVPDGKAVFFFWNAAALYIKSVSTSSTGVEVILFEE